MATAEGYDPAVWRQLSEDLALPGIHVPEQYGGAGFGMVELCIVTEEFGRALLCAPYFSTAVLAANAILSAGTEAQKSALLPDLAKGAQLATLAVTEPDGNWDPAAIKLVATPDSDGYRLDGVKSFVVDGHVAELLVVAARIPKTTGLEGLALFTLDANAAGVERRPLESMDPTRKLARIDFRGAHANLLGSLDDGAGPILRTLDRAAIALANEMVGGAQTMLDSAVSLCEAAGAVRADHRLVPGHQAQARRYAAGRRAGKVGGLLRSSGQCGRRSRMARARQSGQSCRVRNVPAYARSECIQIHGGIGFTWDNDTHLWFKRAKSSEVFLGQPSYHRELLMQRWGV